MPREGRGLAASTAAVAPSRWADTSGGWADAGLRLPPMGTAEAGRKGTPARVGRPLARSEAVALAHRYVDAYNKRDLQAMLAVQHEEVVSHPARLFGRRPHAGHAGVRAWWEAMEASGRWYEVVVSEVRQLGPDRLAILGEIRDDGEVLSPWGVLVRVRDGLIIESRSYLSDQDLLDALGLIG